MPSIWTLSTACVDCQRYEGTGTDLKLFHPGHQLVMVGTLRQAWVLLMNGIFPFLGRDLGQGSFND